MIENVPNGFDIDEKFFLNEMPKLILENKEIPRINRERLSHVRKGD